MSDAGFQLPPPPPAGLNYIEAIKPGIIFSVEAIIGGTIFIPVFILLFLFSTSVSRRSPVFYLNITACLIVFATAALSCYVQLEGVVNPLFQQPNSNYITLIALSILPPLFYDSILLTRIIAFYPRLTTPRWHLYRVMAYPVIIKFGRFTVLVLYLHSLVLRTKDLGNVLLVGQATWFRNPYMTTEWVLQMTDNL